MVAKAVIVGLTLLALVDRYLALTCLPCDRNDCGPPPTCSYGVTRGVCSCCYDTCFKGPGEACGGTWGFSGTCGDGLECEVVKQDMICKDGYCWYPTAHRIGTCVAREKCLDSNSTRCDNISTQQTPSEPSTTDSTNDSTGLPSSIAEPTPTNIYNGLYLYEASVNGDVASVNKSLAAESTNISWQNPDEQGATALHAAAKYDHRNIVIALIDAGAEINMQDEDGLTPLHYASMFGSIESVAILTDFGADVDIPDKTSESTAMHKAARYNHASVLSVLLRFGAKINRQNYRGWTPLLIASYYGSIDAVHILIVFDAKVDISGDYGVTALHMAAMKNHINIVTALLYAGANINQQDDIGWTPLSHASDYGSYEAVAVLIDNGAIVDIPDKKGYTPLHRGTKHNNPAIVTALLEAGSDRNRKTDSGQTPIYLASGAGNIAAVNILITYEAEVNNTEKLVSHKTDLNIPAENGFTALHLAAGGNHLDIAEILLQKGADASKQDKWGRTPVALAQENGHKEIVEMIYKFTRTTDKINNSPS